MVTRRRKRQEPDDPMSRAIGLARRAVGSVSPNPPVGAVIIKDGHVVGEGFTQPPGGPHAEIVALRQAGRDARGAELYVTLEPCAHYGRTPPCVDAIIDAGIRRVHIAALDPNPRTDGRGVSQLEQSNVTVLLREGSEEARELIEAFSKHVTTAMPFVVAKFAMSLDGKIATRAGDSKWISSQEARKYAHGLRASVDAVMVGIGTALADDPQLTVREAPSSGRQPLRVVIDSKGRLPATAAMLREPGATLVATAGADSERSSALQAAGAQVLDTGAGGEVDLEALLKELGKRDVVAVLVEGGAGLLGSLFDRQLIDKVIAIVAPVVIGGTAAPGPIGGNGASTMQDALRLTRVTYRQVDTDMVVTGYPSPRLKRGARRKRE